MSLTQLPSLPFFWPLVIAVVVTWAHLVLSVGRVPKLSGRARTVLLVILLATAAIALVIAVSRAAIGTTSADAQARGVADRPYSLCVVYGFPDGQAEPQLTARGGTEAAGARMLDRLLQDPEGCVEQLQRWLRTAPPDQIIVSGRADRRALTKQRQDEVVSNERLALTRAHNVFEWITAPQLTDSKQAELLRARTLFTVSGLRYVSTRADGLLLEQDRSVEVRAFWDRDVPEGDRRTVSSETALRRIGASLNDEGMDSDVAVAVLALLVALSAYLATVGFFMRQRLFEIRRAQYEHSKEGPPSKGVMGEEEYRKIMLLYTSVNQDFERRELRTRLFLRLLPIADIPMILAAFSATMHVFFFMSTNWMRASVVLGTYSVLILVGQHCVQWVRALTK